MDVQVVEEAGYFVAMMGLSLSYNQEVAKMPTVAERLRFKGDGHNKFLESIAVWLDINAPRYWWQQFDTYRCGMTKQSESTEHTILRTPFSPALFQGNVSWDIIDILNELREAKDMRGIKTNLPESFLQRRIVATNYRTLQTIKMQREKHKMTEWQHLLGILQSQLTYPELIWE